MNLERSLGVLYDATRQYAKFQKYRKESVASLTGELIDLWSRAEAHTRGVGEIPAAEREELFRDKADDELAKAKESYRKHLRSINAFVKQQQTAKDGAKKKKLPTFESSMDWMNIKLAGGLAGSPVAAMMFGMIPSIVFNTTKEAAMKKICEREVLSLPIAPWIKKRHQFALGVLNVALILGCTGDLRRFPNPGKLHCFMACAPISRGGDDGDSDDDDIRMASTWRRTGGLTKEDWDRQKMKPAHRVIMYNVADSLIKNNKGIYRAHYDKKRADFEERHRDHNYSDGRCYNHGNLMVAKLVLLNLWIEWRRVFGAA